MRRLRSILIVLALFQLPAAATDVPEPAAAAGEASASSALAHATAQPRQPLQVVMYGTQECGYCRKSRAYFDRRGIAFVEHDVGVSVEAFDEFEGLGGYVVPMFVINGSISHGYNSDEDMDQRLAAFGW
jgi:glutaredoxin